MSRLHPEKLHVKLWAGTTPEGPVTPRRYTLTHSDLTGELFLTIGPTFHRPQISGWHTRLLRDEVLAEWQQTKDGPSLHVHCHVSGGLALGPASWRDGIFRRELPLALAALRYGDDVLYQFRPELDHAPIHVHFNARQPRYNRIERWGSPVDYQTPHIDYANNA